MPAVQRLAGSDAGFLFIETPNQTSICVDLAELAPATPDAPPLTLDDVRAHVVERLPWLPSWRWRLETVPLQLHHPVWIEDPDFDLDYHLRERTVAAPGGPDEVEAVVADVLPRLLDRRHPLWRITLLHGLAGGRQGLLFQIHHALADGAAILYTLDQLLGPVPDGPPPPVPPPDHPRRSALLRQALRDQARSWRAVPSMVRDTKDRFAAVLARREEDHPPVPGAMGDAPGSVLNRMGPPRRTTARTTVPLADLQRVRRAADCTLNDVALGMVAGGLRAYLLRHDQLPATPLVANVPVSGDPPGTPPRQWGNRFANFFAYLATDVDDPVERLQAIAAATAEAKLQLELQGHFTLTEWLERIPPAIGRPAARRMIDRKVLHPERADYNVLVSNVRVLHDDLGIGPWRVANLFLSGPIGDDAGLNVTVVGFDGTLHVTVVASPACVPDATELVDDLRAAAEELVTCTA